MASATQRVSAPFEHSSRPLSNNEPQHPLLPPRPRPPRRPSRSHRRHPQAPLQVPAFLAVRTTSLEVTTRRPIRCLAARSPKHLEVPRAAHCSADRTTRPAEAPSPARLSSAQSQRLLLRRPLLLSLAVLREENHWEARRPHCSAGTKTRRPVQTKPRLLPHPHLQPSLVEEPSLAHQHSCLAVNKAQHPPAKLPPSVSAQHQHPQAPRSLPPA